MIRVTITVDIDNDTDEEDEDFIADLEVQYNEGSTSVEDIMSIGNSLDVEFDVVPS